MAYKKEANVTVDNIDYDETKLSSKGEEFEIRDVWMPKAQSWSPVYSTLTEPFSFDNYTSPRVPIDLGPFDISSVEKLPRILRTTIKPVNDLNVHLPKELLPLKSFIQQVLEYERMINEKFEECEIHITTDYGYVEAAQTQRFPGWHVDGLQGGKFKINLWQSILMLLPQIIPQNFVYNRSLSNIMMKI